MTLLSMRGIEKRFGAAWALRGVDLDVEGGRVVALLGENGAGKSTLMNVLAGVAAMDAGTIELDGSMVTIGSPATSARLGIGMVHQHDAIIGDLTVAENLELARPDRRFRLSKRSMRGEVEMAAERAGVALPAHDRKARSLGVGERQRIEFVRALMNGGRFLVLDEATAALTPHEGGQLLDTVRRVRDRGVGIIFITHRLAEVEAIADSVTVLRRGRGVGTLSRSEFDRDELTRWMVGEGLPETDPTPAAAADAALNDGDVVLAVDQLTTTPRDGSVGLRGISFSIRSGEVVGIAGVDGNGQGALFEVLTGLSRPRSGGVSVAGVPLRFGVPGELRRLGGAIVPGDRRSEGLALSLSIEENLILSTSRLEQLRPYSHREVGRVGRRLADEYQIRGADLDQPASRLSGGNQQRIVLARELSGRPNLLLLAQPTRGLDVAATRFVHEQIRAMRQRGGGILLVSSDLDEVLTLSDRVHALSHGELRGDYRRGVTREEVGRAIGGGDS